MICASITASSGATWHRAGAGRLSAAQERAVDSATAYFYRTALARLTPWTVGMPWTEGPLARYKRGLLTRRDLVMILAGDTLRLLGVAFMAANLPLPRSTTVEPTSPLTVVLLVSASVVVVVVAAFRTINPGAGGIPLISVVVVCAAVLLALRLAAGCYAGCLFKDTCCYSCFSKKQRRSKSANFCWLTSRTRAVTRTPSVRYICLPLESAH